MTSHVCVFADRQFYKEHQVCEFNCILHENCVRNTLTGRFAAAGAVKFICAES